MDSGDFRARLADTVGAHVEQLDEEMALARAELDALARDRDLYVAIIDLLRGDGMVPLTEESILAATVGIENRPEGNGHRVHVAVPNVSQERVQRVYDAIRLADEPVTAKRIIEATGISQPQVNLILRELAEGGAIKEAGRSATRARLFAVGS